MSTSNQVCIVTGAAQGLGRAVAEAFIEAGAKVALVDVNQEKVAATARILDPVGTRTLVIGADLTDSASAEAMVASTSELFGRVDVLVNNAGGSGNVGIRDIEDITDELWHSVINQNLHTTFNCCRAVAPTMKLQKSGRIINFSSRTYLGSPGPLGTSAVRLAYCAAKGGIHGLTNQLSHDLAPHGITVNIIMPGFIMTEDGARVKERYEALGPEDKAAMQQYMQDHPGTPQDIASAVLYLASPGARMVNGQTITVS